jgi:hypothetical protein
MKYRAPVPTSTYLFCSCYTPSSSQITTNLFLCFFDMVDSATVPFLTIVSFRSRDFIKMGSSGSKETNLATVKLNLVRCCGIQDGSFQQCCGADTIISVLVLTLEQLRFRFRFRIQSVINTVFQIKNLVQNLGFYNVRSSIVAQKVVI